MGEEEIAFLQPTSGTSGEARAAMITQANVLASLGAAREMLEIGPRDVLVSWVPPWHDLGLLRFVLGPVYFGAPCHLVPPAIRTLPLWLRTASEVRATILGAPDFAWRLATRLVDPAGLDLSSLRFATNGGEPVRRSTILAFEERFGVPGVIRPGYGLAEATLGVTGLRQGEPLRVDDRGNVSCGRPFPGVEVRIAQEDGAEGEILVRGAAVFAGYFDAPGGERRGPPRRLAPDRRHRPARRGRPPLRPRPPAGDAQARRRSPGAARGGGGRGGPCRACGSPPPSACRRPRAPPPRRSPSPSRPIRPREPSRLAADVAAAIETALGFAPDRVVVLAPRTLPRTANGKIRHPELRRELIDGDLERRGAVLFSAPPAGGVSRQQRRAATPARSPRELPRDSASSHRAALAARALSSAPRRRREHLADLDLHPFRRQRATSGTSGAPVSRASAKGPRASSRVRPRQGTRRPGPGDAVERQDDEAALRQMSESAPEGGARRWSSPSVDSISTGGLGEYEQPQAQHEHRTGQPLDRRAESLHRSDVKGPQDERRPERGESSEGGRISRRTGVEPLRSGWRRSGAGCAPRERRSSRRRAPPRAG